MPQPAVVESIDEVPIPAENEENTQEKIEE